MASAVSSTKTTTSVTVGVRIRPLNDAEKKAEMPKSFGASVYVV